MEVPRAKVVMVGMVPILEAVVAVVAPVAQELLAQQIVFLIRAQPVELAALA